MKISTKGFSLAELIAVVAIVGILAGVAFAAINGFSTHAKERASIATATARTQQAPKATLAGQPRKPTSDHASLEKDLNALLIQVRDTKLPAR